MTRDPIEDPQARGDLHVEDAGEDDDYDDSYLFPMPSLKEKTSEELRAFIAANMADAHDQTDGTDMNSDVRIDHAQDAIEQARDILMKRGHSFTQEDREQMSFLSWPLTPEEQAEKNRRDAIEAEQQKIAWAKAEVQRNEMRDIVSALIRGEELPGVEVDRLQFNIGDSSIRGHFSISGAEVLAMTEKLRTITGDEPKLAYCCSAPGIKFADDPAPGWGLYFYLTKQPELWALLTEWMRRPDFYVHASVWDYRPEKTGGVWVTVTDLFERAPDRISELWSTGHPGGVVSVAQNDVTPLQACDRVPELPEFAETPGDVALPDEHLHQLAGPPPEPRKTVMRTFSLCAAVVMFLLGWYGLTHKTQPVAGAVCNPSSSIPADSNGHALVCTEGMWKKSDKQGG
ncbi:hypothetical protein [Paraburkholderia phytofirmans]|uniref:Transmembrane protein n=1 Tax=Paraburkholderia phytofirmans (strain DSM 17436 / LMG 22146 / PsJN) TaxID=398527 RepID=B2THA5_PARPJ|nr:hypothetical protein [Paraburkholderia phytofirmans]ACD21661.1 hypothetical protein Bphyt_7376 [Paraburkholderia phytofirmans PsJN]